MGWLCLSLLRWLRSFISLWRLSLGIVLFFMWRVLLWGLWASWGRLRSGGLCWVRRGIGGWRFRIVRNVWRFWNRMLREYHKSIWRCPNNRYKWCRLVMRVGYAGFDLDNSLVARAVNKSKIIGFVWSVVQSAAVGTKTQTLSNTTQPQNTS